MDEYNDGCPVCGGQVYLIGAIISCRAPVYEDGWALSEGPVDTSDEVFECTGCNQKVPFEWVFGEMGREQAAKIMEAK